MALPFSDQLLTPFSIAPLDPDLPLETLSRDLLPRFTQPSITLSPVFGILGTGSLRSPGVNVRALLRSWEDDPSTFWGIDRVLEREVELDPSVCVG